jgi:hypothetical protein
LRIVTISINGSPLKQLLAFVAPVSRTLPAFEDIAKQ